MATAATSRGNSHNKVTTVKVIVNHKHIPKTIPAVPATCTASGLTEGSRCGECDIVLEEQEEVPVKEHTKAFDPAVLATCTEVGWTGGIYCSVCGEVLISSRVIPAKGHTQKYGWDDEDLIFFECSVCGDSWAVPKEGENPDEEMDEPLERPEEEIPEEEIPEEFEELQ